MPAFLIPTFKIVLGQPPNNGWNKAKNPLLNGNADGAYLPTPNTNGIYIYTYFGNNMNANSMKTMMLDYNNAEGSAQKSVCHDAMFFAQQITAPTRPSSLALAITTTSSRRRTLKQMFSNNVRLDL